MTTALVDHRGNPFTAPKAPGVVHLTPTPASLWAKPDLVDKDEFWRPFEGKIAPRALRQEGNHIQNAAYVRNLLDHAEEENEARRQWERRHGRTFVPIGGGAAGSWTLTNELRAILMGATGAIVPATDTVKMGLLLSTTNISASSTTYAAVTNEVATANGYTQGGVTVTMTVSTVSTSNGQLAFSQAQWTASGGSITARYVLAWKSAGHIYAYALCDSTPADVTATNGNTFTVAAGNLWTIS